MFLWHVNRNEDDNNLYLNNEKNMDRIVTHLNVSTEQ